SESNATDGQEQVHRWNAGVRTGWGMSARLIDLTGGPGRNSLIKKNSALSIGGIFIKCQGRAHDRSWGDCSMGLEASGYAPRAYLADGVAVTRGTPEPHLKPA